MKKKIYDQNINTKISAALEIFHEVMVPQLETIQKDLKASTSNFVSQVVSRDESHLARQESDKRQSYYNIISDVFMLLTFFYGHLWVNLLGAHLQ